MTLVYQTSNCIYLDHAEYLRKLYINLSSESDLLSYAIKTKLFCIKNPDKTSNRKRSSNSDEILEETLNVKHMYEGFKKAIPTDILSNISTKFNLGDTAEVRVLSKNLFESTAFDLSVTNGGNNSDKPLLCTIKDNEFLIPPYSRFYSGCVKEQCQKVEGKFDIVIADPPWWNKFIRRLKSANDKLSYKMMYNEDIASIPIKHLLSDSCLVAIWCTNSPSNIAAVKNLIFPTWGVEYITTWYWLKVDVNFLPICGFEGGCKKQSYERLILGKVGELKNVPETKLLVSVPSALHSHKPPLLEILQPYIEKENPETLELFARYLLPHTTSVGFEPLKWQHISLYDKVS